jgi:hypothetical protein
MRTISLSRDEAEWLVDLLEECDPKLVGSWRFALAEEIRFAYGMTVLDPNGVAAQNPRAVQRIENPDQSQQPGKNLQGEAGHKRQLGGDKPNNGKD